MRVLSSNGEASNPDDMAWLMGVAGGRLTIEYCGGTEVGGGYVTDTVSMTRSPRRSPPPALGWDLRVLGEDGEPAGEGLL